MRHYTIYHAEGHRGDETIDGVTITIKDKVPTKGTSEEQYALYTKQGTALAEAIWSSCPGGTVDALIAALLRHRASLFRVAFPHTEATP